MYTADINCRVTIFDRLSYDSGVRSTTSEYAEYHCNQFNTFIEQFKENVLFSEKVIVPALIHVYPTSLGSKSKIIEKIQESDYFRSVDEFAITGLPIKKTNYHITEYNCTREKIIMDAKTADFGIITILSEELAAIQTVFQLKRLPYKFGERIYYSGMVHSEPDDLVREIVCTQTLGQGETSVVNAYHDMIHKYHPKIVFLIGIAGGVLDSSSSNTKEEERRELDLCDVVIARSVVDYELRKEATNGIEHRGQCYNIEASIAVIVNEFMAIIQEKGILAIKGSKNETLNVLFDAIGSGNAVIANQLSSIIKWLKDYNSKVAAVEMEATGISSAFYESFGNGSDVKGLIIVRGISDLADADKQLWKKYRSPAAKNAAIVSRRLMEIIPSFD